MRAVLSAVGIAIGIASMVAVLGISESSKADLISTLDGLGTNLLTVTPGRSLFGEASVLPTTANRMLLRVEGIEAVTAVEDVDATVRRTPYTPEGETGGIAIRAADLSLLQTLSATVRQGSFLDQTNDAYTVVVLADEHAS